MNKTKTYIHIYTYAIQDIQIDPQQMSNHILKISIDIAANAETNKTEIYIHVCAYTLEWIHTDLQQMAYHMSKINMNTMGIENQYEHNGNM